MADKLTESEIEDATTKAERTIKVILTTLSDVMDDPVVLETTLIMVVSSVFRLLPSEKAVNIALKRLNKAVKEHYASEDF